MKNMKNAIILFVVIILLPITARSMPIQWTLGDVCGAGAITLCGSFFFDPDTGNYSNLDLTFVINIPGTTTTTSFNNFLDGDQFFLRAAGQFPSVFLYLGSYDLTQPFPQPYYYRVSSQPVTFTGGGEMTPDYDPVVVPAPGTMFLLGLGFSCLVVTRRKRTLQKTTDSIQWPC